jgi:Phage tail protein RIFT-related domain
MTSPMLTGTLSYVREDGVTLDLNDGVNIKLRHHDGFGIPEFQHAVSPSPGIDGDYWFGVRYPPRIVTVDVTLYADGLGALQNLRREVISKLNPTVRTGRLEMVQANGVARRFDCVLAESLPMPTTAHIGQRAMMLTLRFRSTGEPFLYDPAEQAYTAVSGTAAPGNFMVTGFSFPFRLSQSGVYNQVTMNYQGDVPTPVEITVYGPGLDPVFSNETLGRRVSFLGSGLLLGDRFSTLVVDMDPRHRDVIYQGGNGWPKLRESGFWWLVPGPNVLTFEISGSTNETLLMMRYRRRYLGV